MNSTSINIPRKYARLPVIQGAYGLPRSRIYDLLSRGVIRARKDGRALLVEVESVEAYFATLPEAAIRRTPAAIARASSCSN